MIMIAFFYLFNIFKLGILWLGYGLTANLKDTYGLASKLTDQITRNPNYKKSTKFISKNLDESWQKKFKKFKKFLKNENVEDNQEDTETSDKSSGHIMISYNKESRDLCLKIKKELESVGFKIWIGNLLHKNALIRYFGCNYINKIY